LLFSASSLFEQALDIEEQVVGKGLPRAEDAVAVESRETIVLDRVSDVKVDSLSRRNRGTGRGLTYFRDRGGLQGTKLVSFQVAVPV
jgi:hypothetical protein